MCDRCRTGRVQSRPGGVSRRTFLAAAAVAPVLAANAPETVGATGLTRGAAPMPAIIPRSQWASGRPVQGNLEKEDVRFLVVHHTYQPGSDYAPGQVADLLRSIYDFHTGSKRWADVAYNFFVDIYGNVWEGRAGSVDGPVRGSATGGNQGYSQLCCFLGDFTSAPPPVPALDAMYSLLAWLADRYGVDTTTGATVEVTSLGSNRWPAGSSIVAPTIAAHRDMSLTECPGDACYALIGGEFPAQVTARRMAAAAPSTTTTTAAVTTTTAAATTAPDATSTTGAPSSTESSTVPAPDDPGSSTAMEGVPPSGAGSTDGGVPWMPIFGVAATGGVVASGLLLASRRNSQQEASDEACAPEGKLVPEEPAVASPAAPTVGALASLLWTSWPNEPGVGQIAHDLASGLLSGPDWWDRVPRAWDELRSELLALGSAAEMASIAVVALESTRALVLLLGDAEGRIVAGDGNARALPRDGLCRLDVLGGFVELRIGERGVRIDESGWRGDLVEVPLG